MFAPRSQNKVSTFETNIWTTFIWSSIKTVSDCRNSDVMLSQLCKNTSTVVALCPALQKHLKSCRFVPSSAKTPKQLSRCARLCKKTSTVVALCPALQKHLNSCRVVPQLCKNTSTFVALYPSSAKTPQKLSRCAQPPQQLLCCAQLCKNTSTVVALYPSSAKTPQQLSQGAQPPQQLSCCAQLCKNTSTVVALCPALQNTSKVAQLTCFLKLNIIVS